MKRRLFAAAITSLMLTTVSASAVTIVCERGPFPKVSLINGASDQFITSIEASYQVTHGEAVAAAKYVCADMSAVGDSAKLRALTKAALANYRRR